MSSLTDRLYLAWLASNCPEVTGHRGGLFYRDREGLRPGASAFRPVLSVGTVPPYGVAAQSRAGGTRVREGAARSVR